MIQMRYRFVNLVKSFGRKYVTQLLNNFTATGIIERSRNARIWGGGK
jgi:hypothetical protein